MQKLILFVFICFCAITSSAQAGFCKITKASPDKCSKAKITFKFLNPQGKPATSHLTFKVNGDEIIQPEIDKTGTYEMEVEPGTYLYNFYVKYWHDVNSKPIVLKPKTNTFVTVKFEAMEIGTTPVK
jgi:hypothetical protein